MIDVANFKRRTKSSIPSILFSYDTNSLRCITTSSGIVDKNGRLIANPHLQKLIKQSNICSGIDGFLKFDIRFKTWYLRVFDNLSLDLNWDSRMKIDYRETVTEDANLVITPVESYVAQNQYDFDSILHYFALKLDSISRMGIVFANPLKSKEYPYYYLEIEPRRKGKVVAFKEETKESDSELKPPRYKDVDRKISSIIVDNPSDGKIEVSMGMDLNLRKRLLKVQNQFEGVNLEYCRISNDDQGIFMGFRN